MSSLTSKEPDDTPVIAVMTREALQVVDVRLCAHHHFKRWYRLHAGSAVTRGTEQSESNHHSTVTRGTKQS